MGEWNIGEYRNYRITFKAGSCLVIPHTGQVSAHCFAFLLDVTSIFDCNWVSAAVERYLDESAKKKENMEAAKKLY